MLQRCELAVETIFVADQGTSMKPEASLTPEYFEGVYAASSDPWQFETSPYEQEKYAATMAALPQRRFGHALEIGCSIGVLTALLAPRCDRLLALDVNKVALQQARQRLAGQPNVAFAQLQVPQRFPDGAFDLVLVSEVGYYWSRDDLQRAAALIVDALLPGGALLLVHWTASVPDYPLDGDDVHECFMQLVDSGPLNHRHGECHDKYRLDLFERVSTKPSRD